MGWGISRLIGLKAAVLLSVAYIFQGLGVTLISFPLIYVSMIAMLISIASHPAIDLPLLLGKASDGSFPLWSWIMFSPFLLFIHLFVLLRRFVKNEPLYTEIADGVFVGGWPSSIEHLPPGDPAVIDCTCELPKSSTLSKNAYLCIATWDTRAPQPSQIESAVRWAVRKRSQNKPVYVHCAYGKYVFLLQLLDAEPYLFQCFCLENTYICAPECISVVYLVIFRQMLRLEIHFYLSMMMNYGVPMYW